jgi:hypothetical protein
MLERLLLGILLVWLFPLMSNARLSVATRSIRHLPLSLKQLFIIRSVSLLIPPFAWIVVGASLGISYSLAHAPNPLAGISAALLFILFSWLTGLTVAQLISVAFWRSVGAIIVVAGVFFAGSRTSSSILQLLSYSPGTLVSHAALGEQVWSQLLILAVLTVLALAAAVWSFQSSLDSVEPSSSQKSRRSLLFLGKTGPLSAKDFRYFRRLLDPYFGLLASALGCFYLLSADTPTPEVFWIFIVLVFFPNAILTFNAFGLDSQSVIDRYALLPLSGREIIWSKNRAYVATMLLELAPLFVLGTWRLGPSTVVLGIIEAALLSLAYLIWGNTIAVTHRFKMQFYRFSSGGSPIDALAGVIFGSVPGAIALQVFGGSKWWVALIMLIVYGVLYWCSLTWSGRKVEQGIL